MHVGLNDPMVRHMLNQLTYREATRLKESQKKSLKQIIQASLKSQSDQEFIRHYERFCRQAKEYTALERFIDKHCNEWKAEGRGGGYHDGSEMEQLIKDVPPSFRLIVDDRENFVKIWADDKQRAIIYYGGPDLSVFTYPDQASYLQEIQEVLEEYGEDEDEE